MEIKKKYIHMNHEKGRANSQITLDDDYNLPDYKPDIVKVMKKHGEIKFEQIKASDGHIYVKGSLNFIILYRSDLDVRKLDSLTGELPFEETISMDGVDELDPVILTGDIEDLSIGIINSRKLNLRALVMLQAVVKDVKEEQLITDAITDEPAEMKKGNHNVLELLTCKKDNFRYKQEIELTQSKPNVDQILWKNIQLRGVETRIKDHSIALSGEVVLYMLYYTQGEEARLEWLEEVLPLSGSVACDSCGEEMVYQIEVSVAHSELEVKPDYDGEDRLLSLDMMLDLNICIWQEEQIELLEDIYSLHMDMVPSYQEAALTHLLTKNYAKCKVSERMTLDHNQENILQICFCEGTVQIDQTEISGAGIMVEGSLDIELLYITTDDTMPIGTYKGTLAFEQFMEVTDATEDMVYELHPMIEQLSVILIDNMQIEVKAVINLNLVAFEKENIQKICEIKVTERDLDQLQKQPGITGYIVTREESLWDIAKLNHTTIMQLIETNELASEQINKGDKLLIVKTV